MTNDHQSERPTSATFWQSEHAVAEPVKGTQAMVKYMESVAGQSSRVLIAEHPTGARVKPHKHPNGRLEYIIDGEIEFFEGQDALRFWRGDPEVKGTVHGPGTVSFVPANTLYGYRINKASKLLHVHETPDRVEAHHIED